VLHRFAPIFVARLPRKKRFVHRNVNPAFVRCGRTRSTAERLPRKKRLVRAERDRRKCNKSETGRAIFWRGAIMAETAQLDVGHLLEPEAVAKILGKSRATLARWRCDGFGPAFIKIGGSVAYCPADVEAFIRAQRRLRTTGASGARQVVQQ
jgi:predicted DNA-binding transcriptional regulator AlpA